jgi:4-amino-4-deoxy-L-arabinose transferase-like glycosyltransferase
LTRAQVPGWTLWLLLAVCWFASMPWRPLLDPDEARYAEIPREMLVSGDWVTPRLDGLKYFEKPPLQYWGTAATYSVFGVSEWTGRLWAVGLAFLSLPLVYGWTRRRYGTRAALVALVAMAATPYFVAIGHLNLLDAAFTFWLTGAVLAFLQGQCDAVGSSSERRWMLMAWAAAALAVLSKGIVVAVLAGLALVLYTVIERDAGPWRRLHVLTGLPLFLLIAAPWFVVVSMRNPEFPGFFFVHEHFARFLTTVHDRQGPWWYFLPYLLLMVLPWSRVIYAAVRDGWVDPPEKIVTPPQTQRFTPSGWNDPGVTREEPDRTGAPPQFKPRKFLLIYAAGTLLFFSVSGSKLPPYILPMVPALAILVGVYAADRPALLRDVKAFFAGMMVLTGVGLMVYSRIHNGDVPNALVGWSAAAIVVGLLPLALRASAPLLLLCAASVLGWDCVLAAYTAMPPLRTGKEVAIAALPSIQPQTDLFSVGEYRHSLTFYLGRPMVLVGYAGELEFGVEQEPNKAWATPEDFMARWRASQDAVAFVAPEIFKSYQSRGLTGRVVASDARTIVVSRK